MVPENYGPVDWSNSGIDAVKSCGASTVPAVPGSPFNRKNGEAGARLTHLNDARASCDLFKSCA